MKRTTTVNTDREKQNISKYLVIVSLKEYERQANGNVNVRNEDKTFILES